MEYSEMPFDSTLWQCSGEGDLPIPYNLAKGQLLPGLYEALLTMRKGEKSEILVHPDLAYGKLGCAPRIPPGQYIRAGTTQWPNLKIQVTFVSSKVQIT
jgi:FK506-binding protein 6